MIGVAADRDYMQSLAGRLGMEPFSFVPDEDEHQDSEFDEDEEEYAFYEWAWRVAKQVGLQYGHGVLGVTVVSQYSEGGSNAPFAKVNEALATLREKLGDFPEDQVVVHIRLLEA